MKTELPKLPILHTLHSIVEFKNSLNAFTDTLDKVIKKHVPLSKPTPFKKCWWLTDLSDKWNQVCKLARKVYCQVELHNFDHPVHEEPCKLRNEYTEMIHSAKQEHWIIWLKHTDECSIWTIHHFISSSSGDGTK